MLDSSLFVVGVVDDDEGLLVAVTCFGWTVDQEDSLEPAVLLEIADCYDEKVFEAVIKTQTKIGSKPSSKMNIKNYNVNLTYMVKYGSSNEF